MALDVSAHQQEDGEVGMNSGTFELNTQDLEGVQTTALHFAAYSGNVTEMMEVLARDDVSADSVNSLDGNGRTPLIYAVIADAVTCVRELLAVDAKINQVDSDGRTALHWAAHQNNYKMMKYLLQEGADSAAADTHGRLPLHLATAAQSSKCVKMLMKVMEPASIDASDQEGMAAIHWCAAHDHPKHLDALISGGANLNLADSEGKTALHWCSAHASVLTAQLILQTNPNLVAVQDNDGRTALHLALSEQNFGMTGLLIQSMSTEQLSIADKMKRTPLHWAAVLGITDAVVVLLEHGVDPMQADEIGATALHYGAQTQDGSCIQVLLQNSNMHESLDAEGRSPMTWAASAGNLEGISILASVGMDVHLCDNSGGSTLHVAAYSGNAEAIRMLIQMGAAIDALDNQLHSPIFRACEMGHADAVTTLLELNASVDLRDTDGRSPLHWAALGGSDYICLQLLERKIDIDIRDVEGRTALQCASFMGHHACMLVLCTNKADVNAQDNEGVSAMHWAAASGNLEAVKMLYEHGAFHSPREKDGEQLTPLDYARIGNAETGESHEHIAEFLLTKGAVSIEVIKNGAAAIIQNKWREFKTTNKSNSIKTTAPSKTSETRVPKTRKPALDMGGVKLKKKSPPPEVLEDGPVKVADPSAAKDYTKSILEKERMRQERRVRERKARDEARAKEDARRQAEEKKLLERRQQILMRSVEIRKKAARERTRITQFREKQKAASVIQTAFKEQRRSPSPVAPAGGDTETKASQTIPKATFRSPIKHEPTPQLAFHKLANQVNVTPEWKREIAVLTIQLHWRQYARRKALARAAKRRELKLYSWSPSVVADKQKRRINSIYGQPIVMQQYQPAVKFAMSRPLSRKSTSPAKNSFKFAVSNYSIKQAKEKKVTSVRNYRKVPSPTKITNRSTGEDRAVSAN